MAPRHSQGLFFDRVATVFGGTQALRGVSLHVDRGEIVALLGESGAGKSTPIKILGGIHEADSGRVVINGETYAVGTAVAKPVMVEMPFVEPANRCSMSIENSQYQRLT